VWEPRQETEHDLLWERLQRRKEHKIRMSGRSQAGGPRREGMHQRRVLGRRCAIL
jgi:hypothetical protein